MLVVQCVNKTRSNLHLHWAFNSNVILPKAQCEAHREEGPLKSDCLAEL